MLAEKHLTGNMKRRAPPDENELERYWNRVTHPCGVDDSHLLHCRFAHTHQGRCDCDDRCYSCFHARHVVEKGNCPKGCATNHDDPYVNYATHPEDQGCGIKECCPYTPDFPRNEQNPYYEENYKYERRLVAYGEARCAKDGLLCGTPECSYCCDWREVADEWVNRSIIDQIAEME